MYTIINTKTTNDGEVIYIIECDNNIDVVEYYKDNLFVSLTNGVIFTPLYNYRFKLIGFSDDVNIIDAK